MKTLSVILFLIGALPALFLWFVYTSGDETTKVYSTGVFGPLASLTVLGLILFVASHIRKRIFS